MKATDFLGEGEKTCYSQEEITRRIDKLVILLDAIVRHSEDHGWVLVQTVVASGVKVSFVRKESL